MFEIKKQKVRTERLINEQAMRNSLLNKQLKAKLINEQKKEVFSLQKKLEQCIKVLEDQKNKVRLKDEENKILVKELTDLQLNYEKMPLNKNENKNEEEEK